MLTLACILAVIAYFKGTTAARSMPMKSSTPATVSATKTAIVVGSTGLVGSELIAQLQASPQYARIVLLNRRPSDHSHPKIAERVIDFNAPDLAGISGDDLYCALGTTRRKAGSPAAQRRVDYTYPVAIAVRLRAQGVKRVFLVSSLGADAQARNFYLRTKGELEKTIIALGFDHTVIVRPSFLIGRRAEFRLGEEAALLFTKLFSPLMLGSLRKYKGIAASLVAQRLVRASEVQGSGVLMIESDQIEG